MAAITFVPDEVLDKPLDDIIANGDLVHLTGEVTDTITYAQVVSASIGNYVPTITKANDDAGTGRKAILAAATGVVIDTSTNFAGVDKPFDQYIIVDTANSKIKFIGVGSNKILSHGDTVNTPVANIINPAITVQA